MRFLIILIVFSSIYFSGCSPKYNLNTLNLAKEIDKSAKSLKPIIAAEHVSFDSTNIKFNIYSKNIAFSKSEGSDQFTAKLNYALIIFDLKNNNEVVDSLFFQKNLASNNIENGTIWIDNIIKMNFGKDYLIEIIIKDVVANSTTRKFIQVKKSNQNDPSFFVHRNKNQMFKHYLNINEKLELDYINRSNEIFYVRCYFRNFDFPPPPFSQNNLKPFNFKPDSVFTINKTELSSGYLFSKEGIYLIQSDTSSKSGKPIFVARKHFPNLKKAENLWEPLRYISDNKEFEILKKADKKKPAIDQYWLNKAGSKQRARELIAAYYNRVQDANQFFTGYLEGWKTDRGLIYIIFGKPNVVYRNAFSESWIYGEDGNINSISFNFYKVNNPFTENDFMLDRAEIYKTTWYRAVDTWRQGRIY